MKKTLLMSAMLSLASFNSFADISVNGFGSLRAGQINPDKVNPILPNLYNNDEINFKDQSLFGLQFSSDLGEGLSATLQLTAEGKNDFDVKASWAYLNYDFNDTYSVRAGRMPLPLFYQSDYEKVGFAHNFSRLPKSVYFGFDFSTIEGVSLMAKHNIDNLFLQTRLSYGAWNGEIFQSATQQFYDGELNDIISFNFDLGGDWWNVFGGYLVTDVVMDDINQNLLIPMMTPAFQISPPTEEDIALLTDVLGQTDTGVYAFAGFKVDYNNFLVDFEWSDYGIEDSSDTFNTAWYAALGYRFNDFIVTVHTEEFEQDTSSNNQVDKITNPVHAAAATQLIEALAVRNMTMDGITIRYDFHPSAALKLDYFRGDDSRPEVDTFSGWSVGVDFVF